MATIVRTGMAVVAGMMFLAFSSVDARVITYSGECGERDGKWIVVITLDDVTGRVTRVEGTNCYGEHWVGSCRNPGDTTVPAEERPAGDRSLSVVERPAPGAGNGR